MSKTELLISLSNLLLPSPPYLSKQQLCPSTGKAKNLTGAILDASVFFTPHLQALSESHGFCLQDVLSLTTPSLLLPLCLGLSHHHSSLRLWPYPSNWSPYFCLD